MTRKNPFDPGFGKVPTVFIDREEIVKSLGIGLMETGSPYRTTMICGVRGVGKTALLADVCNAIRKDKQWIVADLPSNGDMMETLIQTIQVKADSDLRRVLHSIDGFSVSVLGTGFSYSAKEYKVNSQLLLEQMLEKMQEKGKHLLVAIDEATAGKEMKLFVSIYQIMIRRDFPISLIMTGLPRNISELQNDKVLTFLLRSGRVDLPMLNRVNVQYSYKETFEEGGITVPETSLRSMTELTKGYSYAFQLLGYLLWETGAKEITAKVIDSVMTKYEADLFRNAYSKIYEETSSVDREFLYAMAQSEEEPVPIKHIVTSMKKAPGYVSTYRRRLVDSGIIQADSYGHVSFALPLFKKYMAAFHF